MNRRFVGVLLIIMMFLIAAFSFRFWQPVHADKQQKSTSDSVNITNTIRIGLDDWVGYFILRSPEFKNRLRAEGWAVKIDSNPDIPRRMKMLNDGELDFAVFDVSSDVLSGKQYDYPGTMIAAVDKSVGGDSIWARSDKAKTLDDLKGNRNLRIAFTPDSPSHFLLKATNFHFAVPEILPPPGDPRRIEVNGAKEAYDALASGKADVAVLWEPYGSKAKAMGGGMVKLLGSEDTDKLIVDTLLVSRKISKERSETVSKFLGHYFAALKYYRDNPDELYKQVKNETGVSEAEAKDMLGGIDWPNLRENCEKWFGVTAPGIRSEEGIVETIGTAVKILIYAKDFQADPIPNNDPYRLIQSGFLRDLYVHENPVNAATQVPGPKTAAGSLDARFAPLDDKGWSMLREVGTLKVGNVLFRPGDNELDNNAQSVVAEAAANLKNYPKFRWVISGHTSTKGDEHENQILSQERAEAVARYLQVVYNADPNRMRVVGYGGTKPLAKEQGESNRAYEVRLPRVEIQAWKEDF